LRNAGLELLVRLNLVKLDNGKKKTNGSAYASKVNGCYEKKKSFG
jgi:hypothetical protein